MKIVVPLILTIALTGCAGNYMKIADTLNERNVSACLEYQGTGSLGAPGMGNGQGSIRIYVSSGGVHMSLCRQLLRGE